MNSNNNGNGEQSEVNELCLYVAALPDSGEVSVEQIEKMLSLDPKAGVLPVDVYDPSNPSDHKMYPALLAPLFVAFLAENGHPGAKCRLMPEVIQSARRFAAEAGIVFGSNQPQQAMAV